LKAKNHRFSPNKLTLMAGVEIKGKDDGREVRRAGATPCVSMIEFHC
jgi:hypothetical protein